MLITVPQQSEQNSFFADPPNGHPDGLRPATIDSLKLLIPFGPPFHQAPLSSFQPSSRPILPHDTTIICPNLSAHRITINKETGDVLSEELGKTHFTDHNGHTTHYQLFERGLLTVRGRFINQPIISITLSAKLLGKDYFDGITPENLIQLYQIIVQQKIINCSLETFLNSRVLDIDIKSDFHIEAEPFINLISNLKSSTKERFSAITQKFNSDTNLGIQWGQRSNKALPTLKIYHKSIELKHQSNTFLNKALEFDIRPDIARLEATFHNAKLLRQYHLLSEDDDPTLQTVAETVQQNGLSALKRVFSLFQSSVARQPKMKTSKPDSRDEKRDETIREIVELCLQLGLSQDETVDRMLRIVHPNANYSADFKRRTISEYNRQIDQIELPSSLEIFFWNSRSSKSR